VLLLKKSYPEKSYDVVKFLKFSASFDGQGKNGLLGLGPIETVVPTYLVRK
jgi:hypothetical protein